jgi:hypothetical protein
LLEKHCEARGDEVFVATYSAQQKTATGEVSSYCAWGKGVGTLLPKTDFIGFVAGITGHPPVSLHAASGSLTLAAARGRAPSR